MRQILFVFAILGAVLSGWVPAIAATLSVAQPAGMHAVHQMATEKDDSEHGNTSKPAAHPVACSACFAIEAFGLAPVRQALDASSPASAAVPQLIGVALPPLDPPPRS
ncbi:hypothetical protein [Sinorhizobium sp. RAC02]|uniref:hypothetical protein n=1 Tax=Sinorhizobium sp. RAC02 TaxID=1842534 RepID=UPI00083CAD50|nr:hypothetical protein [Sinorhizobium sp. RAC02]AOF88351.1 hypothetical protein BSY16_2209 [Sinorhizobium sp. RAC02]